MEERNLSVNIFNQLSVKPCRRAGHPSPLLKLLFPPGEHAVNDMIDQPTAPLTLTMRENASFCHVQPHQAFLTCVFPPIYRGDDYRLSSRVRLGGSRIPRAALYLRGASRYPTSLS